MAGLEQVEAPGPPAPIACSLGAEALASRLATVTAIGQRSLLGVDRSTAMPTLRFRSDPPTLAALEQFVAAERACCGFLDLSLREADGVLMLAIAAPAEGAAVVEGLVAAFSNSPG